MNKHLVQLKRGWTLDSYGFEVSNIKYLRDAGIILRNAGVENNYNYCVVVIAYQCRRWYLLLVAMFSFQKPR